MTAPPLRRIGRNSVLMGQFVNQRAITDPLRVPVALTTMTLDTRCPDCLWPAVCAGDRTCWRVERGDK